MDMLQLLATDKSTGTSNSIASRSDSFSLLAHIFLTFRLLFLLLLLLPVMRLHTATTTTALTQPAGTLGVCQLKLLWRVHSLQLRLSLTCCLRLRLSNCTWLFLLLCIRSLSPFLRLLLVVVVVQLLVRIGLARIECQGLRQRLSLAVMHLPCNAGNAACST